MITICFLNNRPLYLEKNIDLYSYLSSGAVWFGTGVFTSFRSFQGRFLGLDLHLARLEEGILWQFPRCPMAGWKGKVLSQLGHVIANKQKDYQFRIQLGKTDFDKGEIVVVIHASEIETKKEVNKLTLIEDSVENSIHLPPFLKHHHYAHRMREKRVKGLEAGHELLFHSKDQEVYEATTSNLVCRIDGQFWTPQPGGNIFAGSTIKFFKKFCDEQKLEFRSKKIFIEDLMKSSGLFLLNAKSLCMVINEVEKTWNESHLNKEENETVSHLFRKYLMDQLQPL